MPIPALTTEGWLPTGVHVCTVAEIEAAFGMGGGSGRRMRLFNALREHLTNPIVRRYVEHVLVNGSFVSQKADPGDVDMVLGVRRGGLAAIASGGHGVYGAAIIEQLEGRFVPTVEGQRAIHGFADEVGGTKYGHYFACFQQSTREIEPKEKGVLRVNL
jgi:hypothetical protein